ncbi:LamG-like jellyroll fold domain-containing protein [Bacteroidota bacterium]
MRPIISFYKQSNKRKYCIGVIIIISFLLSSCEKSTEPDNTPPTVTITSPINGASVSEYAKITCVATDTKGIDKVSLWVDGIPIEGAEDNTEPYELVWNTANYENLSVHTITVRAIDKSDNKTDSAPIILIVDNSFAYPTQVNIESVVYYNNSFILKWSKCPNADFYSYTLYQALFPDMSNEEEIFMSNNDKDTSYIVSDITEVETRFYQLVVEDSISLRTKSNVYLATNEKSYPTRVNITSIIYEDNTLIVKWQKSPDLDFYSYALYQSLSPDMSDGSLIFMSNELSDTTYIVNNVDENEVRYYKLVVENNIYLKTESYIYQSSFIASDPYAYYPFNGNINDESGNNNNGFGEGISFDVDRYGNENSAAYFSGSAWIQLPDTIRFQPRRSATISFWLKTSQSSRFDIIDQRGSSGYNFGIIYNIQINGRKRLEFNYPGYHPNRESEDTYPIYENVDNNEWQHFVFIKEVNQGKYSIYINGELLSEEILGDADFEVGAHLLIGKNYHNSGYYTGLIDDLYFYSYALPVQKIKYLYEE